MFHEINKKSNKKTNSSPITANTNTD